MGRVCNAHGGDDKRVKILAGSLKEKYYFEDMRRPIDGRLIIRRILDKFRDVNWIHLGQDRSRWRALTNTIMT
jgi:hypothetical protein